MPLKKQDIAAGLKETGYYTGHHVAGYDPALALRVLDAIAVGDLLKDIFKRDGMPSYPTWLQWLNLFPALKEQYENAREISAMSLEDEALGLARELLGRHDFTGVRVRGYDVAMGQLRWSASKRDAKRFGSKEVQNLIVPIQINTSLDIGQGGAALGAPAAPGDIYTLTRPMDRLDRPEATPREDAEVVLDSPGDDTPGVPPGAFDPSADVFDIPVVFGAAPDPSEWLVSPTGLTTVPVDPTPAVPQKVPRKRLPKKHKTPAQIRATKVAYSRREGKS